MFTKPTSDPQLKFLELRTSVAGAGRRRNLRLTGDLNSPQQMSHLCLMRSDSGCSCVFVLRAQQSDIKRPRLMPSSTIGPAESVYQSSTVGEELFSGDIIASYRLLGALKIARVCQSTLSHGEAQGWATGNKGAHDQ